MPVNDTLRPMAALGTRRLGIGGVSMTCAALRGADEAERALHDALEAGLDLVEVTAEEAAERVVGDAIRALRAHDRVIAAFRVPARELPPPPAIQERIEAALRTSRLEVLPLAHIQVRAAWRSLTAWPELVGTCARLVREGKVLRWGALVDTIEDDTHELASEDWLVSLAAPFNLCERGAEKLLRDEPPAPPPEPLLVIPGAPPPAPPAPVPRRKLPLLARRPLAGGAFAGTLAPGMELRIRDDRRTIDEPMLERIAVGVAKLAAYVKQVPPAAQASVGAKAQLERNMRPAEIHCATVAELAMRYVISRGAIAMPRLHRREHVADAVAIAGAPPLPADLLDQLDI